MNVLPPHFLVEEGPEKGREIIVPAGGARIGRATENDISIADAAMSRFQCRVYFRDGFLHVMDLGSTNETLVNNKPVTDQALRFGDELLIGESLLRVVRDGLPSDIAAPEPGPAPIVFKGEEAEPPPAPIPELDPHPLPAPATPLAGGVIDLGLGRRDEPAPSSGTPADKRNPLSLVLVTLVTMLVVFGVGFLVILYSAKPPPRVAPPDNRLRVYYEKVVADQGNISRYAIDLGADGQLSAQVHDLAQQRDFTPSETVGEPTLLQFRDQMLNHREDFFKLRDRYESAPQGRHESYSITLVFGRDVKSVRVANQPEPSAFREMRENIEAFAGDQLGLSTLHMPPEELRRAAQIAWDVGQKLYREREVKDSNLWEASQKMREVEWLLQSIEPKPAYHRDAVRLRLEWREELNRKINELIFEANRSSQLGDRAGAAAFFRRIMAALPDENERAFREARTNLVRLEQELQR